MSGRAILILENLLSLARGCCSFCTPSTVCQHALLGCFCRRTLLKFSKSPRADKVRSLIVHPVISSSAASWCTIAVVTITYSKVLLTESAEGFHVFWFCIPLLTSTYGKGSRRRRRLYTSTESNQDQWLSKMSSCLASSTTQRRRRRRRRGKQAAALGLEENQPPLPRLASLPQSLNMLLLLHSGAAFHSNFG